ncbi:MAG: hypothetical protein LRY71_04975 [Bacillaceae bacterium]|nr:hypothetical protein [Bacillaceae bacterium]
MEPLRIKTQMPVLHTGLIKRKQLLEKLNSETISSHRFHKKVTFFVAPAGYGKTTAVRQWVDELSATITWSTLDKTCNEPSNLLKYIVKSLENKASSLKSICL